MKQITSKVPDFRKPSYNLDNKVGFRFERAVVKALAGLSFNDDDFDDEEIDDEEHDDEELDKDVSGGMSSIVWNSVDTL